MQQRAGQLVYGAASTFEGSLTISLSVCKGRDKLDDAAFIFVDRP